MKQLGKTVIAALLMLCLLPAFANAEVTTSRDSKGVWFIKGTTGDSLYDVFKAMGYAVATDRLWQAEKFRRAAKGELSEIFGQQFLEQDIQARVTGYTDAEVTDWYEALPPDSETRAVLDGYVAGFNERINEVAADPSLLPYEFQAISSQLGRPVTPDPWTPEDVLVWASMLLRQFDPGAGKIGQIQNAVLYQYLTDAQTFGSSLGAQMFEDLRWTNDPDAQTYIPKTSQAAAAQPVGLKTLATESSRLSRTTGSVQPAPVRMEEAARQLQKRLQSRKQALKNIQAWPQMGSYAWVVGADKTATGRPTIYSGPQMGFDVPVICQEGSIEAAGLNISGMAIPGLPGIVIGRTPHHAWSMQVGHAHTTDYYFEPEPDPDLPSGYYTTRTETISVAGGSDVTITVARTPHGPVVSPEGFDPESPETYDQSQGPIIAWRYSHWGREFGTIRAFLDLARAESMDEFGTALRDVPVSQHFCYADKEGNIAYWMSGMDPVRPEGGDYRFPQGMIGSQAEWDDDVLKPLSSNKNTARGFYGGWNNKSSTDYPNSYNNMSYFFGPFHRAHVIEEYLESHDDLTFGEIRDLALNIATTDSIRNGGNPWAFAEDYFRAAVNAYPSARRTAALAVMDGFDGHFVAGGRDNWVDGMDRSDAWVLSDEWIREVIDLTFSDELLAGGAETAESAGVYDESAGEWKNPTILFNVILHALNPNSALTNNYNWFDDIRTSETAETADEIIVTALDNVLDELGGQPWGIDARREIEFDHEVLTQLNPLHTTPFASRSTYAHCVEMSSIGPARIESMFPLGQSGTILADANNQPQFDENFYSMTGIYDSFAHRDFPVFTQSDDDGDTCFIRSLRIK